MWCILLPFIYLFDRLFGGWKDEKETDRAIKAAVDQARKVNQDMERYRNADRLEEAIAISSDPNNHDYE